MEQEGRRMSKFSPPFREAYAACSWRRKKEKASATQLAMASVKEEGVALLAFKLIGFRLKTILKKKTVTPRTGV